MTWTVMGTKWSEWAETPGTRQLPIYWARDIVRLYHVGTIPSKQSKNLNMTNFDALVK